ncbi:CLUMA_CG013185, isoform A [Clunio marinus]|uniref:CLUMA_CG013185, isoform A n=1 Tax=Clunio marinus TaxID=568069 RepID=A0A1J1IJE3_9DIPT|nr:CLUMA_CG013185, isoform A [Clunio marinus]
METTKVQESAILVLYMNTELKFDQSISTAIMHANEFLVYTFTIFGAIVGDTWWGMFKTIAWMSIVYSLGNFVVALAAIQPLNLPTLALTITGLFILAVGSGGVRPNLSVFGGFQYTSDQTEGLGLYFGLQYFVMKCGTLVGSLVSPILRGDVTCFGMDNCYPLAFGTPGIVMLLSFVIFMLGKRFYVKVQPSKQSMLLLVSSCIITSIKEKCKSGKLGKKSHWLDYAVTKHGEKLVMETKMVLNVLVMFLPLPLYWSAFMLQSSRFVFQATRMNGDFLGWFIIKPDQMIVFNPIISIILFPICEYIFYPLLEKLGIKSLLQKMTLGGIVAALGIVCAIFVEIQIKENFISIFWLLPQYLFLALSENFLYIANLNFAYNEAPSSMKSVMSAFVFVTIASGNLIIVFVTAFKLFPIQVYEFTFFATILFIDMIVFGLLATRYQYSYYTQALISQLGISINAN